MSCYGGLLQLNQHLSTGRSGILLLDENDIDEPYFICGRNEDLEKMSQSAGKEDFCFGIRPSVEPPPGPPLDSHPDQGAGPEPEWLIDEEGIRDVPQVKWVNWRWPRYEYLLPNPKFTATCQWHVHNNILLRQFVFRKPDEESRECFVAFPSLKHSASFPSPRCRLIRDADYLDSSYRFNEICRHSDDSKFQEMYTEGIGPNGCGMVLLNKLSEEEDNSEENPEATKDENVQEVETLRKSGGSSEASRPEPPPGPAEEVGNPPTLDTATAQHQIRKLSPSIAAVMTAFVNGKAQRGFSTHEIALPQRQALEVVFAYKLIHLPDHEVDWRNFVISAQEADINRLLREETSNLWGNSSGPDASLLNIGLSLQDLDRLQNPIKVVPAGGNGREEAQEMTETSSRRAPQDGSRPPARIPESLESPPQDPPHQPVPCDPPEGTPTNSSAKTHIEYLTWRNLEHILSVCAIPLSPPRLFQVSHEPTKMEPDIVALTCGDMSGHRVCTSASL